MQGGGCKRSHNWFYEAPGVEVWSFGVSLRGLLIVYRADTIALMSQRVAFDSNHILYWFSESLSERGQSACRYSSGSLNTPCQSARHRFIVHQRVKLLRGNRPALFVYPDKELCRVRAREPRLNLNFDTIT